MFTPACIPEDSICYNQIALAIAVPCAGEFALLAQVMYELADEALRVICLLLGECFTSTNI